MNTTAIFIEYVISGAQFAIGLVVFLFDFKVINRINFAGIGLDQLPIMLLIAFPVLYPIGILIDNLSESVFQKKHNEIRNSYLGKETISSTSVIIQANSQYAYDYLAYIRTKIRLNRSTFFNSFVITMAILLAVLLRTNFSIIHKLALELLVLVLGISVIVLSYQNWIKTSNQYYKQVTILKEVNKAKAKR